MALCERLSGLTRRRFGFTVFAALLALLTSDPVLAAKWHSTGPFGGVSSLLVVDPKTPKIIYEASPYGGVFKSFDRGASWTRASTGLDDPTVFTLAINPKNPSILYAAGGNGIFKSTDGADHWAMINPMVNVLKLAIDPRTPSTLYAVMNQGPVFKSLDSGKTWTSLFAVLPSQSLYAFVVDPKTPANLYAGADGGIYKSINAGSSWTLVTSGLGTGTIRVFSLFINPVTPKILYAQTTLGIEKSTDSGLSWAVMPKASDVLLLAIDPQQPSNLMGVAYPATLFRSTDSAKNWTNLGTISPGFAGNVRTLTIDPVNGTRVYAGTDRGVFASINSGGTWRERNSGLSNTMITALAVNPKAPGTLYAGTQYSGVFKTTNGGSSWARINDGWLDKVSELLVDPVTPSRLYFSSSFGKGIFKSNNSGLSWGNILPFQTVLSMGLDPANPKTLYAGGGAFIVNKSTDAGATWKAANTGLPSSGMQPNSVSSFNGNLLLTDPNFGAFMSTNGGGKWVARNPVVPSARWGGSATPAAGTTFSNFADGYQAGVFGILTLKLIGVESPASDAAEFLGYSSNVPFSQMVAERATSWSQWATPTGVNASDCPPIAALAANPVTPTTFYAGGLCGVLKGTNGGAQLTSLGTDLPANTQVQALAVTSDGKSLFAGMLGGGVYRLALP